MPIRYKIDVMTALKEKGIKTTQIRRDKIFSESTLQKFRERKPVAWENLERLCELLGCQPGDIVEYVDAEASEK